MAKTKTKSRHAKRPLPRGMQNKRYYKTEEAILEVLLKSKTMPSTAELTKKARISRSTLYRHHRAMPGIIPDYERDILIIFRREFKNTLKSSSLNLESIYFKMLIFVLRHKRVFRILFRYSGDRVAENMVLEVKTQIVQICRLSKGTDRMFKIYAKEVAGIIEDWGENGFSEDNTSRILRDIIHLTTTMRQRLGIIRE